MRLMSILEDRAVLSLAGAPARPFLQDLISNDMDRCGPGAPLYAALLTPQGKILFEFFVVDAGADRFLIDCAVDRASELLKWLTLYRLRTKIEIAREPALAVAALWNGDGTPLALPEGAILFSDPRLAALGFRVLAPHAAFAGLTLEPPNAYHRHRLDLGVPDSADLPPDTIFSLDAGLEELNGVSFRKGCYVGQEVTARMKHRGTARRRMLIAESEAPLASGASLTAEGREIGTVAHGRGTRALALVRLDRWAEARAANAPVRCGEVPVNLHMPDWLHV